MMKIFYSVSQQAILATRDAFFSTSKVALPTLKELQKLPDIFALTDLALKSQIASMLLMNHGYTKAVTTLYLFPRAGAS